MLHEIYPYKFNNQFQIKQPSEKDYYLSAKGSTVCCKLSQEKELSLPSVKEFGVLESTFLYQIDDISFFMIDKDFDGYDYLNINYLRPSTPHHLRYAATLSSQLIGWYHDNKFCGRCGSIMKKSDQERMLYCPECHNMIYPKLCPVAIVGIIHEDKLLLTKYADHSRYNHYALVAGFSEFGESIEDTVIREVKEETGLNIKNITYFSSQPWPASSSLIMGFFCEVDGNTQVSFTDNELDTAVWATSDLVPDDDGYSVTYKMMGAFKKYGRKVLEK